MTYTYRVNAKYEFEEIDIQTNSAEKAIEFMFDAAERGAVVTIINGFTGEVLATANHEEDYITEEWTLMILGWLMQNYGGFSM